MNYRLDKYGNRISALGFGCLRFPKDETGKIDIEETEREILHAIRSGVNYFDTAYIYSGSEAALGEILEKNGLREQVYLATKLPHYLIRSAEGMEKLFQEQLARLRTDYVDYYLMHMLTDIQSWERLNTMGILDWLEEKKRTGAIRQVGFSYHGNSEMFCRLVDAHNWDFCMIQYNYLDEHSQAGRRGLLHAHEKGLPVIIMEPLRGGKLVTHLPQSARDIFAAHPAGRTPAQWAFRWLWNQEEVTCVLSGMNSHEMVEDNIQNASSATVGELGPKEEEMFRRVVEAIRAAMKVGCTACGYCMPCPKNVDIPGSFAAYNHRFTDGRASAIKEYIKCTALRRVSAAASCCVGCGKCETHCPQGIHIREELKNVRRELEDPVYKTVRGAIRLLKLF